MLRMGGYAPSPVPVEALKHRFPVPEGVSCSFGSGKCPAHLTSPSTPHRNHIGMAARSCWEESSPPPPLTTDCFLKGEGSGEGITPTCIPQGRLRGLQRAAGNGVAGMGAGKGRGRRQRVLPVEFDANLNAAINSLE